MNTASALATVQLQNELRSYTETTQVLYPYDTAHNQAAEDLSHAETQFREYKAIHFIDPYIKPVLEFLYMQECKGTRIPIASCSAYYRQTLYTLKKTPLLMSHFENINTAYKNYDLERKRFESFLDETVQTLSREINAIVGRYRSTIPPLQLNRLLKQFVIENGIDMDVPDVPIVVRLESKSKSKSNAITQECPVCYTDFTEQKQVAFNCNHTFCIDCIEKFIQSHTEKDCVNCPMCRTEIETISTTTNTNVERITNMTSENLIFMQQIV